MIKNYFKIAFRNLQRNKEFTSINIIGLAIGMASSMLIMLWIYSQFNFDRFYPKTDLIYEVGSRGVTANEIKTWFASPKPLAEAIKNDIVEVKSTSRVSSTKGFLLTVGEKRIIAGNGSFVDSTFLDIFQLPVLAGNPKTALVDPSNIVLTKEYAMSFFGSVDIIGKSIQIDSTEVLNISAVLDDIPSNSRFFKYKYFLPWTFMEKLGRSDNYWNNSSVDLYSELFPDVNLETAQQKVRNVAKKYSDSETEYFFRPISERYLYNKYINGVVEGGRIEMVRVFIIIAVFILLIACINFTNLSTAQSERRAKEVGIRKVVGARPRSLIAQFLSESILLSFISGILAFAMVALILPHFSGLIDQRLNLPVSELKFWLLFLGFILLTGTFAGCYPAFFLSSFQPSKVLKGTYIHIQQRFSPRKVLVVFQFVIAVIMIVSMLVIRKQIVYAQSRDAGFIKENLVYVSEIGDIPKNSELIRQALLDGGIASSVSRTNSPMTERWSGWSGAGWEGKDPNSRITFNRFATDDGIVQTAGLKLIEGRDFDLKKFPTDSMSAIINEAAAKVMGLKNPIGNYIMDGNDKFIIIGVIKDFIQESPFNEVTPTVIEGARRSLGILHIKFNSQLNTKDALSKTAEVFKKYNPNYPFEYQFLDEAYAKKFEETEKTAKLATIFGALTIFISCLGLLGLSAYMAERRTKEIGVRKVLGASVFSVTRMLSKQFVLLVGISCLIAFPIAYWTMDEYISKYAYRIDIGWEIFAITAFLTISITLITISYQSIKAAMANPVNSLRDE